MPHQGLLEPLVKVMQAEMVAVAVRVVAEARQRLVLLALEPTETELVVLVAREQHHPTQALRSPILAAAAEAATTETQAVVASGVLAGVAMDTVLALGREPQAQQTLAEAAVEQAVQRETILALEETEVPAL